jgi:hypothetical protein
MPMRILLLLLLTSLTLDAAAAQPKARANADIPQAGITSAVPAGWTLQPPDAARPGKHLISPDGQGRLSVHETPADARVSRYMNAVAFADGERVTYLKRGASWIVASGFRGDRIFYRKAMLACGNTRWHHIEFDYPASQKETYDRFVTQASHALGAHRNEGCASASAVR